jgi:thiol-disulfide isomerase/thioredoxin
MKLSTLYVAILNCLIFYIPAYAQNENGKVKVYGTIRNYSNVIEVMDNDYSQPLQITNSERSFVPDKYGRFSIEFDLKECKYFIIARNSIYLCPGDQLEVDIDYDDARNSTFKGSHNQENEYLKFIPYPKAGSFLEGGQNVKSTIDQTINTVLDIAKQRRNNLSNFKNLSSEFRFMEQNRIDADLLNSFYGIRWYFPYVHKLKGDSLTSFHNSFYNVIDNLAKKFVPFKLDAHLMKLEVYRDVAFRILKLKEDSTGRDASIINDWFYAKRILHEMQTDTIGFDAQKIASIQTPEYRDEISKTYEKLLNLKGTNATDIILTDVEGKSMNLINLKDKIVFIDVWATWCIPCIKELPYLDSLKERYKNNSDIAFLSLSIDSNERDWLDFVKKNQLTGLQYNTDISSLAPYYVSEIPRTILIDKNFKIYAMRGPMPSNTQTIDILEKMLKVNDNVK